MSFLLFFARREFNVSHTESTSAVEVNSSAGVKIASASDALSAAAAHSATAILLVASSESLSVSDLPTAISTLLSSGSDSANASDSVTSFFAQVAVPSLDISPGSWTPSAGADLYATIDEATPDQNDYIHTHVGSVCEVKLTGLSTPPIDYDHVLRYSVKAGAGTLTVRLMQGAIEIASFSHAMSGSAQQFIDLLSPAQAANITDYTDLRLRFEATL